MSMRVLEYIVCTSENEEDAEKKITTLNDAAVVINQLYGKYGECYLAGGFWVRLFSGEDITEGDLDIYYKRYKFGTANIEGLLVNYIPTSFMGKGHDITYVQLLSEFDFSHCAICMKINSQTESLPPAEWRLDTIYPFPEYINWFVDRKYKLLNPKGPRKGLQRLFKYHARGWRCLDMSLKQQIHCILESDDGGLGLSG